MIRALNQQTNHSSVAGRMVIWVLSRAPFFVGVSGIGYGDWRCASQLIVYSVAGVDPKK